MELIQLAAAVALRLEGAVHSIARGALKEGPSREEVHHALILLYYGISLGCRCHELGAGYNELERNGHHYRLHHPGVLYGIYITRNLE